MVGKSLGTDLARCKMTLPLIHFLRTGPAADVRAVRAALESGRGADEAAAIRAAVVRNGSIEHAMDDARGRIRASVERLDEIEDGPAREILREIDGYVLARRR